MSKPGQVNKTFLIDICREYNIPIPTPEQALKMLVEAHILAGKQDDEIKKLEEAVIAAAKGGDGMYLEAETLLKQLRIWSQKTFQMNAALMTFMLHHEELSSEIPFALEVRDVRTLSPYFKFLIEKPKTVNEPADLSGFPKLYTQPLAGKKKKDDDILN